MMRGWLWGVAVFGLALVRDGSAGANLAGEAPASHVYIEAGATFDYHVTRAPLPHERLGAIALAGIEQVRDPSAGPLPSPLGDPADAAMAADWPARGLEAADPARGAAPLAAREDGRCRCATEIGDVSAERVAVLRATRRFRVGDELDQLRLLEIRARYGDGIVLFVNGREVARRNLARDAGPLDFAERPRGPEWETFHVPVLPGLLRAGDNLLAAEVRPSGRSLAPHLDLALASAPGGRIVRGPIIQRVGPTSAVVAFETDLPTTGVVQLGTGRVVRSAGGGLAMRHVVTLDDLPASSRVDYRVLTGSDATEPLSFFTAPGPDQPLRFAVYGDVRGGHDTHTRILSAMLGEAPDLVVVTGDLVLRGSDEGDWQRFFRVAGELLARVPYYPAVGNHDTGRSGDEERRMNEIFELWPAPPDRPAWGHWYSFDVAGVHFVMLDSNAYEHHEQLEWLKADLAAARARGARAIFVACHDGPYSRGLHRGNQLAAEHYAPVLADAGVTLLFSGHDHLYQRGRVGGLPYMVSGGGGAPLYSVRCGVRGKRRCRFDDGMQHVASEHHYIMLTVHDQHVEACPRRIDGSPLESCVSYRLAR